MDNLIEIKIDILDDRFVVDSRSVACNFQKRHDNVLRDIENIKKDVLNFEEMFIEKQREKIMVNGWKGIYLMTECLNRNVILLAG